MHPVPPPRKIIERQQLLPVFRQLLDVTMGEDDCPIYRADAAEILACIWHMGLNMLRAETSRKASVRRKQKIARMSSEYLEKVLNAGLKTLGEI